MTHSATQSNAQHGHQCRFCRAPLQHTFVDLGMSPLCESYVAPEQLQLPESFYPLHAFVCDRCFLVQLLEYVTPQNIFSHYAYFSSFSDSWLAHAKSFVEMVTRRFEIGPKKRVVEIASNDGYLLQYFVQKQIPALGIEPAANIAEAARKKGIETLVKFFGVATARDVVADHGHADLIVANNVLPHVPDINDFVAGLKMLLSPHSGVITLEFPHLVRLIDENQFDTIYHEHFSYLSLYTVEQIFAHHGLSVFDVEELPTHGGSLRVYAQHSDNSRPVAGRVATLRASERKFGVTDLSMYHRFEEKVGATKHKLLEFLIAQKRAGRRIAGYGAPGKGNTLLNFCGIRTDFIDFTVDRNPFKQGKFLPGTRIPIHAPEEIRRAKPDLVMILPWNLKCEIADQLGYIREWGGKFFVPIPEVGVF